MPHEVFSAPAASLTVTKYERLFSGSFWYGAGPCATRTLATTGAGFATGADAATGCVVTSVVALAVGACAAGAIGMTRDVVAGPSAGVGVGAGAGTSVLAR